MKGAKRELRLALRALRVMRRHLSYALNLNPMRPFQVRKLRAQLSRIGQEERALIAQIDQPQYP